VGQGPQQLGDLVRARRGRRLGRRLVGEVLCLTIPWDHHLPRLCPPPVATSFLALKMRPQPQAKAINPSSNSSPTKNSETPPTVRLPSLPSLTMALLTAGLQMQPRALTPTQPRPFTPQRCDRSVPNPFPDPLFLFFVLSLGSLSDHTLFRPIPLRRVRQKLEEFGNCLGLSLAVATGRTRPPPITGSPPFPPRT